MAIDSIPQTPDERIKIKNGCALGTRRFHRNRPTRKRPALATQNYPSMRSARNRGGLSPGASPNSPFSILHSQFCPQRLRESIERAKHRPQPQQRRFAQFTHQARRAQGLTGQHGARPILGLKRIKRTPFCRVFRERGFQENPHVGQRTPSLERRALVGDVPHVHPPCIQVWRWSSLRESPPPSSPGRTWHSRFVSAAGTQARTQRQTRQVRRCRCRSRPGVHTPIRKRRYGPQAAVM